MPLRMELYETLGFFADGRAHVFALWMTAAAE
jgi:hypothetical protein